MSKIKWIRELEGVPESVINRLGEDGIYTLKEFADSGRDGYDCTWMTHEETLALLGAIWAQFMGRPLKLPKKGI